MCLDGIENDWYIERLETAWGLVESMIGECKRTWVGEREFDLRQVGRWPHGFYKVDAKAWDTLLEKAEEAQKKIDA